ncbi:MAG: hypothetical protein O7F71_16535 [Gammaproteobacteria bacterium]|nr:hypothetical protein [Gammaproteobacteria bacterium]
MVVELRYGWRRRLDAGLLIGIALIAGWLLLGNAGAAILGLWSFQFWPRTDGERLEIDPDLIRWGRLHSGRIAYAEAFRVQSIFRGEISDSEYAAVCRLLKSEIRRQNSAEPE